MSYHFKIFILLHFATIAFSQKEPVASYNFDGCRLSEQFQFTESAKSSKTPICGCGLENESLTFDGSQTVRFPSSLNQLFYDDFTIDFYVAIRPGALPVDILSVKAQCSLDSSINLRFLPQTEEILLEISQSSGSYNPLRSVIKRKCWNRITIVRQALNYTLYIDNEVADIAQVGTQIIPGMNALISLSGSPCPNDAKLVGNVDQLNFYNVALNPADLNSSFYFPNTIINQDTTVTQGSPVPMIVGASCFDSFIWKPAGSLSNSNTINNAIARPQATTTYELLVNTNNCIDTSQVTIFVIDPENKRCDELFFPSAFTPNSDNLNDDIGISNSFIIDEIKHYEILDRWGGRITSYPDKTGRWDGIISGKEATTGSYMYNIRYVCDNKEYRSSGAFVLIR
jgi:gliding motility-associated-like protein